MADVVCRCGEPQDSTGGLHFSHAGMEWWVYDQLIRGCGCPTCGGDFKPTKERDERWHRSVQFLSDGSVTGDPYPGWPAPTWPDYCKRPSGDPEYRGSDQDPWDDLIPAAIKVRFKDKDYQLGECPLKADMEEPKRLAAKPDKVSVHWAGIWVRLAEEFISDHRDAPLLEQSNGRALVKMMEDRVRHWEIDDNGAFWIAVGYIRYGKAWTFESVITFIDEVERALQDHPALDEEDYDKVVEAKKEEAVEEVLDELNLAEWVGVPDEILKLYLETKRSDIMSEVELDDRGEAQRTPDDKFFRKLLAPMFPPVHHEILRATADPQVYVLYPKPMECMEARTTAHDIVKGVMLFVRGRKGGSEVAIEARPAKEIKLVEFAKTGSYTQMNWVRWDTLGHELQCCILDLIHGRDPKATVNYDWWPE